MKEKRCLNGPVEIIQKGENYETDIAKGQKDDGR